MVQLGWWTKMEKVFQYCKIKKPPQAPPKEGFGVFIVKYYLKV